jgi:AcrR family transcriptional regulator
MAKAKLKPSLAALESQPGYAPPRYARAGRTTEALLQAGLSLLRARTPDGITIQDLCAQANVTTGAFYGRFESKDAFFKALHAVSAKAAHVKGLSTIAALSETAGDVQTAVRALLREIRQSSLRVEGLLRASMLEPQGEAWQRIKTLRYEFVEAAVPVLLALSGAAPSAPAARRIRIAFQFAVASIVNAVVNDPGPLRLASPEFDEELARAFCAYLAA